MSDDLIRRSDAMKTVKAILDRFGYKEYSIGFKWAVSIMKEIPSADRPQGRNLSEEYPSLFECSVCGASCDDTYPWDCDIKFCPNCGAKMKGADDEKL